MRDAKPGREAHAAVHRAMNSAFVALVVGVIAIEVAVLAAARAPMAELARIGDEHARAVSVASRLRSQLSSLRSDVIGCVEHGCRGVRYDDRYAALGRIASELEPITDTPHERADVAALEGALRRSAAAYTRLERTADGADPSIVRAQLQQFLVETSAAGDAANAIVSFNANEVRDASEHVRRRLLWALGAGAALGAMVIGAGLVLVRQTRRAVARHALALERHSDAMGAFAARAAHELRNPLQTLTLALGSLERDATNQRALPKARASAMRLRETIDVILAFSRAGATVAPGAFADVAEVVRDVLADVAPGAEEKGVVLARDVAAGVRAAIEPAHLRIVVSNLVANAVKHGGGVPAARVEVTARALAHGVEIAVTDNGPGIAPEALPHVFEPFYRATTTPGGFGLGLATVDQLVRAHGGDVAIESAVGRGTTLRVLLPR